MAAPLLEKLSESLGSPEPAVRLILSVLIGEFCFLFFLSFFLITLSSLLLHASGYNRPREQGLVISCCTGVRSPANMLARPSTQQHLSYGPLSPLVVMVAMDRDPLHTD